MKTCVKVFLESGNSWVTDINLSPEDAIDYFLGQDWNVNMRDDLMSKCVKVEVLK
jgi:hypothetical protein